MTWLDLVVAVGFGGLLSLAYNRGIILEITDFVAVMLAGFLSLRMFRALAGGLHSLLFKGWSLGFLEKFSFFLLFVGTFLAVFSVGLTLERRMKEEKVIEKLTDRRLGLAFGVVKNAWLMCLLLGLLFYLDLVPAREAPQLRRGVFVGAFLGLSSFVQPTVYVMAPSDLAKDFMTKGLRPSAP